MQNWRKMMRSIGIAFGLTCVLALSASNASMLSENTWTQTWLENFQGYGTGGFLGGVLGRNNNPSYPTWDQYQLPQVKGLQEPGNTTNVVVNATACSATYALRNTYNTFQGAALPDRYQRISFGVKTRATGDSLDYTLNLIASNNDVPNIDGTNAIPMWDVASRALRPHVRNAWEAAPVSDWIGASTSISDGAWHMMDMVYDLVSGAAEWYDNGVLVDTLPDDPALKAFYQGRPAGHFEFWQKYLASGATDSVMFDDLQAFSALPEPASLAFMGLAGLAMLRRRRSV